MESMSKRHLEMVQELEENFQMTMRENQVMMRVSICVRESTKTKQY